jgi:hypothetical protein
MICFFDLENVINIKRAFHLMMSDCHCSAKTFEENDSDSKY